MTYFILYYCIHVHKTGLSFILLKYNEKMRNNRLIVAGTDINSLDRCGRTPLHLAIGHLRLLHQEHEFSSERLKAAVAQVN